MSNNHKPIYKKWWFWVIIIILIIVLFGNSNTKQEVKNGLNDEVNEISNSNTETNNEIHLLHGELQDFIDNSDTKKHNCVIKAKIEQSLTNRTTITQNFFNVEDFIKNQNGNTYDEIQYWAVANMANGEESKVISFTIDKDTIDKLYNNQIAANQLDTYLSDFCVIDSLK